LSYSRCQCQPYFNPGTTATAFRDFEVATSAPIAANPDTAAAMARPMAGDPGCMRSGRVCVTTADPYPGAANADGPIAWDPDIFGAGCNGHCLDRRRRRSLGDDSGRRRGGRRRGRHGGNGGGRNRWC